jgi:hypothetical protein
MMMSVVARRYLVPLLRQLLLWIASPIFFWLPVMATVIR